MAEGERNKTLEIATAMKSKGFSAEDIAQITGLAAKDIENLQLSDSKSGVPPDNTT